MTPPYAIFFMRHVFADEATMIYAMLMLNTHDIFAIPTDVRGVPLRCRFVARRLMIASYLPVTFHTER